MAAIILFISRAMRCLRSISFVYTIWEYLHMSSANGSEYFFFFFLMTRANFLETRANFLEIFSL
jgi:hypothetical protein